MFMEEKLQHEMASEPSLLLASHRESRNRIREMTIGNHIFFARRILHSSQVFQSNIINEATPKLLNKTPLNVKYIMLLPICSSVVVVTDSAPTPLSQPSHQLRYLQLQYTSALKCPILPLGTTFNLDDKVDNETNLRQINTCIQ